MSLARFYFERVRAQIAELERRSLSAIEQAAEKCAECLLRGGVVHIYDTGHLVSRELINRAGGLAAFTPLQFDLHVHNPNPYREARGVEGQTTPNTVRCIVHAALDRSRVVAGDVLIIGSVSGKTPFPVELAVQARARAVFTIGLTALDYSSQLRSEHESGKRLFEVVDLVIDNAAPYGDGMLTLEGVETAFCPASGIGAAVALWAVVAGIVERMTHAGKPPTLFASINRPDGAQRYKESIEQYKQRGY
ncbi:MAG: sugar isomerase domain-containing protein [Fimbriimonadales bacterium]|nr:sugar isomerase domain-containing protein [Fimbriimonadales bacterium]